MLVSLCMHLKRGETGLRGNCISNVLEQELQRNPFDGFFYLLDDLSIGVLIGSTLVRFRATLPQNITWFLLLRFFTQDKKASETEIIYRGCPKFNAYSVFTLFSVYLQGVWFWCFPNPYNYSMLLSRRCPKNSTTTLLLNQVLLAARLCNLSFVAQLNK